MLEQSLVFSGRSSIHISNSAPSLSIVSDAAWDSLRLLCSTCITYGTPYYSTGHRVLATLTLAHGRRDSRLRWQMF